MERHSIEWAERRAVTDNIYIVIFFFISGLLSARCSTMNESEPYLHGAPNSIRETDTKAVRMLLLWELRSAVSRRNLYTLDLLLRKF